VEWLVEGRSRWGLGRGKGGVSEREEYFERSG
jgi:hypothetical protein